MSRWQILHDKIECVECGDVAWLVWGGAGATVAAD